MQPSLGQKGAGEGDGGWGGRWPGGRKSVGPKPAENLSSGLFGSHSPVLHAANHHCTTAEEILLRAALGEPGGLCRCKVVREDLR